MRLKGGGGKKEGRRIDLFPPEFTGKGISTKQQDHGRFCLGGLLWVFLPAGGPSFVVAVWRGVAGRKRTERFGGGIRDRQRRIKKGTAGAPVTSADTSLLWTHQQDCDIL